MKQRKLNLDDIPPALSFKHTLPLQTNVLVIVKPFFDPVTKQTFSAGTRFVYDPTENDATSFKVYIFDRTITSFKSSHIPFSYAHIVNTHTKEESIACFVSLLRQWAHESPQKIPYVWGGCSYVNTDSPYDYQLTAHKVKKNKKNIVYERTHYNHYPFTGFDCAGLILRAAQACSIPYFYKNTYTLAHYLDPLARHDTLKEGDLIWIPGHVMVVSDIAHNLLVEARGYSHEYGIVQEIELSKVFKGISNYRQLLETYHNHGSLTRMNRFGNDADFIRRFKILKFESVWKS